MAEGAPKLSKQRVRAGGVFDSKYKTMKKRSDTVPTLEKHKQALAYFYTPKALEDILNENISGIVALEDAIAAQAELSTVISNVTSELVKDIRAFLGEGTAKYEGFSKIDGVDKFLSNLKKLEAAGQLPVLKDFTESKPVKSLDKGMYAFFMLGQLKKAHKAEKTGQNRPKVLAEIYTEFTNYFAFIYLENWQNLPVNIRHAREKIKVLELLAADGSFQAEKKPTNLKIGKLWPFDVGDADLGVFGLIDIRQERILNEKDFEFIKERILPLRLERLASLMEEQDVFAMIHEEYLQKKKDLETRRVEIRTSAKDGKARAIEAALRVAKSLNELVGKLTKIQEELGVSEDVLTPFAVVGDSLHYPVLPLILDRNLSIENAKDFFRREQEREMKEVEKIGQEGQSLERVIELINEQKKQYAEATVSANSNFRKYNEDLRVFSAAAEDLSKQVADWKLDEDDIKLDLGAENLDDEEAEVIGVIEDKRRKLDKLRKQLKELKKNHAELVAQKEIGEGSVKGANEGLSRGAGERLGEIKEIVGGLGKGSADTIGITQEDEEFKLADEQTRGDGNVSNDLIIEYFEGKRRIGVDFAEIPDIINEIGKEIEQRKAKVDRQKAEIRLQIINKKNERKNMYKLQSDLQGKYELAVEARDQYLKLKQGHKADRGQVRTVILEVLNGAIGELEFKFEEDKLVYEFKGDATNSSKRQSELIQASRVAYEGLLADVPFQQSLTDLDKQAKALVKVANDSNKAIKAFVAPAESAYNSIVEIAELRGGNIDANESGLQIYQKHFSELSDGVLAAVAFSGVENVITLAKGAIIDGKVQTYENGEFDAIREAFNKLGTEEALGLRRDGSKAQKKEVLDRVKELGGKFARADKIHGVYDTLRLADHVKLEEPEETKVDGEGNPITADLDGIEQAKKMQHLKDFTRTDTTSIFADDSVNVVNVDTVQDKIKEALNAKIVELMSGGSDFPNEGALYNMVQDIIAEKLGLVGGIEADADFKNAWNGLSEGVIALKAVHPINGKLSNPIIINTSKGLDEFNAFTAEKDLEYVSTYILEDDGGRIIGSVSYVENLVTGEVRIEKVVVKGDEGTLNLNDLMDSTKVDYFVDSVERDAVPAHILSGDSNPCKTENLEVKTFIANEHGTTAQKIVDYTSKNRVAVEDGNYKLSGVAAIDESYLYDSNRNAVKNVPEATNARKIADSSLSKFKGAKEKMRDLYQNLEEPDDLRATNFPSSIEIDEVEYTTNVVDGAEVSVSTTFAEREAKKQIAARNRARGIGGDVVEDAEPLNQLTE